MINIDELNKMDFYVENRRPSPEDEKAFSEYIKKRKMKINKEEKNYSAQKENAKLTIKLAPDVARYFTSSKQVNNFLRNQIEQFRRVIP